MNLFLRRFLSVLIIIVMLFTLAACTPGGTPKHGEEPTNAPTEGTDAYTTDLHAETDNPNISDGSDDAFYCMEFSLVGSGKNQNMFETEDGIYIVKDSVIYYSDKEYQDWIPLCGKPECNHGSSTCNASFDGDKSTPVGVYDKYIYYTYNVGEYSDDESSKPTKICRMRLDGSQHEVVLELSRPSGEYETDGEYWIPIRFYGRYFTYVYEPHWLNPEFNEAYGLYILDLGNIEKEPVKFDSTYGGIREKGSPYLSPLAQEGDILYTDFSDDEGFCIGKVDLSTGESAMIGRINYITQSAERHFAIDGDDFVFLTTNYETWETWICRMNKETGELTEINYDNVTQAWGDFDPEAGYIYGVNFAGSRIADEWFFCAYDLEGNEIVRYGTEYLPEGMELMMLSFITKDYLFFHGNFDFEYYNITPKWYVEKKDIGTDSFEFKRWEP